MNCPGPLAERPHRPSDILDVLLAHILKGNVELVAHLVADDAADAKAARLGQTLQSGGEIDPVAENVAFVDDDVALMDAEAELDPLLCRHIAVARGHLALHATRPSHP